MLKYIRASIFFTTLKFQGYSWRIFLDIQQKVSRVCMNWWYDLIKDNDHHGKLSISTGTNAPLLDSFYCRKRILRTFWFLRVILPSLTWGFFFVFICTDAFPIKVIRRHQLEVNNGRKINVWSTNKDSNELHIAVSVAFSVPSSAQSENSWKTALIYSFTADPIERGGAKG